MGPFLGFLLRIFYSGNKQACPLLWRETLLALSPKAFLCTNILEKMVSATLVRHTETRETRGELSPNMEDLKNHAVHCTDWLAVRELHIDRSMQHHSE